MQDSEEDAPQRPSPHHNGHRNAYHEDVIEADSSAEASDSSWSDTSLLPSNGLSKALLTGAGAGILAVLLNVIYAFVTAPVAQQSAQNSSKVASNADYLAFGLGCLIVFVNLAICLVAGYVVGKIAVRRRFGFYAGALVAAILYLASFVTRYIPNYPGNLTTNQATATGSFSVGIVISLVFLLISALAGGLFGLWGARIATSKHWYHQRREAE